MKLTQKDSATSWKITLALLVGLFFIGMAASLVIAARKVSRVVDADYYSRGLHYDQTPSGSKNAGLSWTMSASVAKGELQVRVKDRSGEPVPGGRLRFEPVRRGSGPGVAFALAESAPGFYRAPRPIASDGELHGTLRFTRGEETASQKLVLFN